MSDHDNENGFHESNHANADPQGSASLLLVESLIHGLCEKSLLSTGEAVEIVERALDVQSDRAVAADGAGAPLWQSHALLSAIASSLRADDFDGPPPPAGLQ